MKTELFTISKIFTENLFRIPDYQRGYSWGLDQLKDFWLDLEQLENKGNHYTGVLTLEDVPERVWKKWDDDLWIIESRKYNPYYIVDGQQRITTVIILIQVILESIKLQSLNFTPIVDIKKKYIFDTKFEDLSRSYIFGYEKDNPSYEYLKTKIFLEDSDIHLPDEITIYTKNLLAAKNFFIEKIKDLKDQEIEILYTKVTQQLVFNVYEISDDIDVFVTFETMNNRGKLLSTLELLKNRLIYLSTKIKSDSGKDGNLRRKINDAWKSAYHYLGKNENKPLQDDKFLETHLSYYYLKNIADFTTCKNDDDKSKFVSHYRANLEELNRFLLNKIFSPKRINQHLLEGPHLPGLTREFISSFSQDLKKSVELYYRLSNPASTDYPEAEKVQLGRIGRLLGHHPSPMLMAIYLIESKSEKRVKALTLFERLIFCQSFGLRTAHLYLSHYRITHTPGYIDYVANKMSTDELIALLENSLNELLKETPLVEAISDWIKNSNAYYGWRQIRYFLFEYELDLQLKTKSDRTKLDWNDFSKELYENDFSTVEHIYPQKAKDKYWVDRFSHYSPTQRRQLRNSLGNLLPLARARNSSLGNRSFLDKINGDGESLTGYRYGCFAEIEVCDYGEWNADAILDRGLKLLAFFERRWGMSIGDKSQKIKALGLNFLKS